jgi:hypothetical protein
MKSYLRWVWNTPGQRVIFVCGVSGLVLSVVAIVLVVLS